MVIRTGMLAAKAFLRNPRNIETFTLIKQAAGSRDSTGVFVPGTETSTDLIGSVQPLTGSDRQALPEGERLLDAKCVLYETTNQDDIRPLRIGTAQTDSDIIEYKGIKYAVRLVHDMSDYGHLEIHATRIEGQDG